MASKSGSVQVRKAQSALAFAFQYGFPIYAYGRFTLGYHNPKTNVFYHSRSLFNSDQKLVVRPNNDTLYSPCFVDLSHHDMELVIPEFDQRYWVFPMTDANNYANISSLLGHKPGKYILRYTEDEFGFDSENVDRTRYEAAINSPTPYGMVSVRILVDSDDQDLQKVHAFQDQIKINAIPRSTGPTTPRLDLDIFSNLPCENAPKEELAAATLQLTAAWAPYNPPEFVQLPDSDLRAAVEAADAGVTALHSSYPTSLDLGNSWYAHCPEMIGDYASFYAQRYHIAVVGYLALTRDQVLYPRLKAIGVSKKLKV
ncbi:hypothetical protein CLAIMM_09264 [Cladophialophora immunda]|nr:hypothetical protein CLAIMM_09264 [Cladophialophora immunda]